METLTKEIIIQRFLERTQEHARQTALLHRELAGLRRNSLAELASLVSRQIAACADTGGAGRQAQFSFEDLQEFATGSIARCLGEEYSIYAGRRSPRIPNGDLLLMSRITAIQGRKQQFEQASGITAEYDVPADAWYFAGARDGRLPVSIALEIGLQPCGFLSAYMGTPLRYPEIDFFFRNLDGRAAFTRPFDARGKTITTRAALVKTVFSSTAIIQNFTFELACEGAVFFRGESSFGYFPAGAMAAQAGLDGETPALPWIESGTGAAREALEEICCSGDLPAGKLDLVERAGALPNGGLHGAGYVLASRQNSPQDWYYACHFHEDPVMPGSLGIEAIAQAMQLFIQRQNGAAARVSMASGQEMVWKYRGQVLQKHHRVQVEIHFRPVQRTRSGAVFSGDASLWADDRRIYAVHNLAFEIQEGRNG